VSLLDTTVERKKILLIDDTPAVLHIFVSILKDEYDVIIACDGEQGLVLAKKIIPDLIILDVIMPGMSGYDVLSELKVDESTSHIPVILVSGKTSDEDEKMGYTLGAVTYIKKPFHADDVKEKICSNIS